jgi:hypothetical protein
MASEFLELEYDDSFNDDSGTNSMACAVCFECGKDITRLVNTNFKNTRMVCQFISVADLDDEVVEPAPSQESADVADADDVNKDLEPAPAPDSTPVTRKSEPAKKLLKSPFSAGVDCDTVCGEMGLSSASACDQFSSDEEGSWCTGGFDIGTFVACSQACDAQGSGPDGGSYDYEVFRSDEVVQPSCADSGTGVECAVGFKAGVTAVANWASTGETNDGAAASNGADTADVPAGDTTHESPDADCHSKCSTGDAAITCSDKPDVDACSFGFSMGFDMGCTSRCDGEDASGLAVLKSDEVVDAICGEQTDATAISSCTAGFLAGVDQGGSNEGRTEL